MKRLIAVVTGAVVMAMLGAGCGPQGTKRAVDPRIEALRFFPADVQLVAQLRVARIPAARKTLGNTIDPSRVVPIAIRGEMAIGGSVAELRTRRPLLVVVTSRAHELSQTVAASAKAGKIGPAGVYRHASLYETTPSGPGVKSAADLAYAVRDGVLLAGSDIERVRSALDVRDGSRDGRLDDHRVAKVFDQLPNAPVRVFADLHAILPELAGAPAWNRVKEIPWLAAIGDGAASVRRRERALVVAYYVATDRSSLDASQLPLATGIEAPTAHRLGQGVAVGLRDPAQTARFLTALGAVARGPGSIQASLAPILQRTQSGPEQRVPGAAGALVFSGTTAGLASRLGPPLDLSLGPFHRLSGYAEAETDALRGRIELRP